MSTLVLGTESFSATPDVNGLLVLLNGGGLGTITAGTLASRPAASTTGNLYVDTTNSVWYYDTGAAWVMIDSGPNPILGGTASVTIPVGTTAQRPASPTTGMIRYNSTTGQYEGYDTSWGGFAGIIDKSTTSLAITATVATTLVSFSVPANTLGTTGNLRLMTGGTWLATTATRSLILTLSYGATNLWSATTGNLAAGATVGWEVFANLSANNSASAQTLSGHVMIGQNSTTNVTAGVGSLASTANIVTIPQAATPISGTSAISSASAQTFALTVTQSGAGTVTRNYYTIESM